MRSALPLFVGLYLLPQAFAQNDKPPFYTDKANLLFYIDSKGKSIPVKSKEDWQLRRRHILDNMQLVMGSLPSDSKRVEPDLKVVDEEKLDKVIRKKITFAVEKDDRLTAYLLMPKELPGKVPAVLCLHQTVNIGKGEPAGLGGKENLRYALELAERGYITLAPDYPNFGDYKIDVYAKGYVSATMKGIWNHRRCIDLLQSLPEVEKDQIGCIGHSLGGHNSLFVSTFDSRIKVVVTSCGFNSFFKYYKGNLKGWSHKGYMPRIESEYQTDPAKMPFDFTEIIGALAPRAIFINAPMKDENFEVSGVRDCVGSAEPIYKLLKASENLVTEYPDAGHDFPPEVRQKAYQFINQQLRKR